MRTSLPTVLAIGWAFAACASAKPNDSSQMLAPTRASDSPAGRTPEAGSGGAQPATSPTLRAGSPAAAPSGSGAGGRAASAGVVAIASRAGAGGTPAGGASGASGAAGVSGASGRSGANAAAGASGAASGGAKFHVFLLLGQSNMAGFPKATDADKQKNPRITVLGYDNCMATGRQQDAWDVAVPPLHECWNGAIGPGDYFAKTLIDKLPAQDSIGLVPCAISGEKIETFLKVGGAKYDWIIQRAKLAQRMGGVIEGMLFHQGESNNGDASWPGKVKTLVSDLETDLGLGQVPFLAGELAYEGSCAGHNKLVNMLPGMVPNAYVVSATGLALDPTDTQYHVHFGHEAQVTFGQRYATKMLEALHW